MCGLVGLAGNLAYGDDAIMKRLLIFDYFRGTDSTGMAAIRKVTDHHLVKVDSNPLTLFDMKSFDTALNAHASLAYIGHNRAATRGKVNANNAHPFRQGSIYGAHNGTLDTKSFDDLQNALNEKFDVDSEAVFAAINTFGIEETMSMMSGAWALTWYDDSDDTLNFIRNKERPLYFAYTKEFDKIFWASEYPFINAALANGNSGLKYDLYRNETGHCFFPFEEDMLYSYELNQFRLGSNEVPKPIVKKLKGKEPLPVAYQPAGTGSPFQRNTNGSTTTTMGTPPGTGGTTSSSTATSPEKKYTDKTTITIATDDGKPFAEVLDRNRFHQLARNGCSWCSADIEYDDVGVKVYDKHDAILCSDCSGISGHTNHVLLENINHLL